MNLNVKLDGEEEQPLQYVNRFAFNIPSGATAFNLNIVNPGLGNQSYILNPMNSVGQSIVAYQPQVALQSYIALPTETEGNIIHSLPVGVPVPVGLPVSTGLLQNNFVNTSIIIGNEDCNERGVKSPGHSVNPESEIKINYIEKPLEPLNHAKANKIEVQNVGVNRSSQATTETTIKKPCPLEMSIKAANIDIEFEKCDAEIPILLENCHAVVEKEPFLVEHVPLDSELKDGILKVPFEVTSVEQSTLGENNREKVKTKTEITWENNNKENSGFQESLICEVEEANDDDEDEDGEERNEEDELEEEEDNVKDVNNTNSKQSDSSEESNSSEENDSLPLSVAFRLGKPKQKKFLQKKKQRDDSEEDNATDEEKEDGDWSESDDDILNFKRIRNEFNYKCFYKPKTTKSGTSLVLKIDNKFKKFVRVRSCCSKRECGKKIAVQDQKTAHKHFHDLESDAKREAYLMNCIEYVQKNKTGDNAKDNGSKFPTKLEDETDIRLEIENESNGNQKLSDEIQKAINESLKDCVVNEESENCQEEGSKIDGVEKPEKNSWNFYIVIDRCRKKVCLQFLLKLFQIPKSQIKHLQKKILSGSPPIEDSGKVGQRSTVWELAKSHLDSLDSIECSTCTASPRHRLLTETRTKEDLYDSFKTFYFHKLGKELNIKYASYKRFLDKKTSMSVSLNQEGTCLKCEEMKKYEKRKQSNKVSSKTKKGRESKKQWVVKSDSEDHSSDDEPLLKRKKLKLTIPLKAVERKPQQNTGKPNCKKYSVENRNKGKTKPSGSRGRDVWSLMLLHLETMPYKECKSCVNKKRHRFLDPSLTTQGLFEDYRKYFLKETNSELGLGFTMYEKYFNRNCNYLICDVDVNSPTCPGCAAGNKS